MELASGTMADLFKRQNDDATSLKKECKRLLDLPDVFVLFQIASGLEYLHSRNIVHGDIKPENILISRTAAADESVQVKLSDFGISRNVTFRGNISSLNNFFGITKEQTLDCTVTTIKGSPAWTSPELIQLSSIQLKSLKDQGNPVRVQLTSSDMFSYGLVSFYYVTKGIHPFGSYPCSCPEEILLTIVPNIKDNKAIHLERIGCI